MVESGQKAPSQNIQTRNVIAEAAMRERGHGRTAHRAPPHLRLVTKERRVRQTIPTEDERDIRRYFSEGATTRREGGICSNFTAMLDRMDLYSKESRPCLRCGGEKEILGPDGEVERAERGGSGFLTGCKELREYLRIGKLLGKAVSVEKWVAANAGGDLVCKACRGRGWVTRKRRHRARSPEPTVGFTGAQPVSVNLGAVGGSDNLALIGAVSRRLAAVRRSEPVIAAAIELYYSPDGGSARALWSLTPAGRTMLRQNSRGAPEQVYFSTLRLIQERAQDANRATQFETADRQATELLARVAVVWNAVVHGGA